MRTSRVFRLDSRIYNGIISFFRASFEFYGFWVFGEV